MWSQPNLELICKSICNFLLFHLPVTWNTTLTPVHGVLFNRFYIDAISDRSRQNTFFSHWLLGLQISNDPSSFRYQISIFKFWSLCLWVLTHGIDKIIFKELHWSICNRTRKALPSRHVTVEISYAQHPLKHNMYAPKHKTITAPLKHQGNWSLKSSPAQCLLGSYAHASI